MGLAEKDIKFFLGANSSDGFYSLFDGVYDPEDGWRGYIIKGGPGTGKSALMRKVGTALEDAGKLPVWIYCSSDSDSLDALILPELKFFMLDGTSPHCVDPKYPGAVENILNMGECWNKEKLRERTEEIIRFSGACSALHAQSDRFLSAAGMIRSDVYRIVSRLVDTLRLESYAKRLALSKLKNKKIGVEGREYKAFLSGITPKGVVFFGDTVKALCDNVYVIEDNYGPVSDLFLNILRQYAVRAGYDVVSCDCPLFAGNKTEHLLIPELGTAFLTSNRFNKIDIAADRRINAMRFIDAEELKLFKTRLRFNKKASQELLNEAVALQAAAKRTHDSLESCYISAMNFKKVDQTANSVIKELLSDAEK